MAPGCPFSVVSAGVVMLPGQVTVQVLPPPLAAVTVVVALVVLFLVLGSSVARTVGLTVVTEATSALLVISVPVATPAPTS